MGNSGNHVMGRKIVAITHMVLEAAHVVDCQSAASGQLRRGERRQRRRGGGGSFFGDGAAEFSLDTGPGRSER